MGEDGVLDTVERLKKLVEMRGECEVFCLVKSPSGLEIVTNVNDYVMQRGMMKVAEELAIDHQHEVNVMLRSECERETREAVAVMSGFKKPVSKAN
jgi:hypothetical protein